MNRKAVYSLLHIVKSWSLEVLLCYPTPKVRGGGWEEQPQIQGVAAALQQEGDEELLHIQDRRGGHEGIPLVQGKEQWLHFAGATMKSYLTSKVRETQVRW